MSTMNTNNGKNVSSHTSQLPDTRAGVYDYPIEFRRQILALMLKPGWLSSYRSAISPDYFPSQEERNIAEAILKHYEEFNNSLPTLADMCVYINDSVELLSEIYELRIHTLPKTQKEVIDWAKSNAIRLAMIGCIDDYEQGDISQIREKMERALRVGVNELDNGMSLLRDTFLWLREASVENTVSTPWPTVNSMISGGIAGGELGLILAPTNSYKTTALVNVGAHGASYVNSRNIIHFSLEMSVQKVLRRYAARVTNEIYHENTHDIYEYSDLLVRESKKKLKGEIIVKHFLTRQATVSDLKDFIMRIQDMNFDPGMIIIDYPDLLKPRRHHKEKRLELQEIYEDCRSLGGLFNIPVWGATPSNRGSFKKKIISLDDMAEDISKAYTADIILALCQTEEEYKDHLMRMYTAKIREGGEARHEVELKIRYPALIECIQYVDSDGITSKYSPEELSEFEDK